MEAMGGVLLEPCLLEMQAELWQRRSLGVYLPLAETNLAVKIESELSADIILLLAAAGKPVAMGGEAFFLSCVLLTFAISMHVTFGDWGSEKLVDWMSR